jgi:arylsulfatase A-like enzyme
LNGDKKEAPHDALYWRFGQQMAIRQGDWKLVRYDPKVDGQRGLATEPKLYNLAKDVGEKNDLIEDEPARADALQAAWGRWNESNVPPRWGGRRRNAPNRKNSPEQAG